MKVSAKPPHPVNPLYICSKCGGDIEFLPFVPHGRGDILCSTCWRRKKGLFRKPKRSSYDKLHKQVQTRQATEEELAHFKGHPTPR